MLTFIVYFHCVTLFFLYKFIITNKLLKTRHIFYEEFYITDYIIFNLLSFKMPILYEKLYTTKKTNIG
jgi:hypothetical protein